MDPRCGSLEGRDFADDEGGRSKLRFFEVMLADVVIKQDALPTEWADQAPQFCGHSFDSPKELFRMVGFMWLWVKNRYQNGTLVSGHMDQYLRSLVF